MAKLRLFPTRDTAARAAAHRAMARAALFSDSSAAVRLRRFNDHMEKARALEEQASYPLHVVYLARSGTRLEIHAPTWQDAIRQTARPDACVVEQTAAREFTVTFDPDCPTIIDFRARYASPAETLRWALDTVLHHTGVSAGAGGAS